MKKNIAEGPSKLDLLKAINECRSEVETDELSRLEESKDAANKAYNDFIARDAGCKRLKIASEKASEKYWDMRRKFQNTRKRLLSKATKLIYAHGATPAVIRLVQEIIEKLA